MVERIIEGFLGEKLQSRHKVTHLNANTAHIYRIYLVKCCREQCNQEYNNNSRFMKNQENLERIIKYENFERIVSEFHNSLKALFLQSSGMSTHVHVRSSI